MPTVFPEHLVDTVIAADAIRRQGMGMDPARYRRSQRTWIEPFFNLLGSLWGVVMGNLPWSLRRPLDLWICQKMQGHPPEASALLTERLAQTVALAADVQKTSGQWPAVLFMISHPPTMGPLHWLRFELLRQGIVIADALAEARSPKAWFKTHSQCFLAIDPYALDTVPPAVGGFYAAWMHRTYMAWDRQPSTQSWIQRSLFLRQSGYAEISWRLLSALKRDVPILMALPGGLPHNARLLYTAREFIQRLKPVRWRIPKLEAENRFMLLLIHPINGIRPAEQGELPEELMPRLRAFLKDEIGIDDGAIPELLENFRTEFRLSVPYRSRLFRTLHARLVKRGKTLIVVTLAHADQTPHIRIGVPTVLRAEESPEEFAKRVVMSGFHGNNNGG